MSQGYNSNNTEWLPIQGTDVWLARRTASSTPTSVNPDPLFYDTIRLSTDVNPANTVSLWDASAPGQVSWLSTVPVFTTAPQFSLTAAGQLDLNGNTVAVSANTFSSSSGGTTFMESGQAFTLRKRNDGSGGDFAIENLDPATVTRFTGVSTLLTTYADQLHQTASSYSVSAGTDVNVLAQDFVSIRSVNGSASGGILLQSDTNGIAVAAPNATVDVTGDGVQTLGLSNASHGVSSGNIRLYSNNGNVNVEAINGDVNVDALTGSFLATVSNSANITSTNGDVNLLTNTGSVVVKSQSLLTLDSVANGVTINAQAGQVDITGDSGITLNVANPLAGGVTILAGLGRFTSTPGSITEDATDWTANLAGLFSVNSNSAALNVNAGIGFSCATLTSTSSGQTLIRSTGNNVRLDAPSGLVNLTGATLTSNVAGNTVLQSAGTHSTTASSYSFADTTNSNALSYTFLGGGDTRLSKGGTGAFFIGGNNLILGSTPTISTTPDLPQRCVYTGPAANLSYSALTSVGRAETLATYADLRNGTVYESLSRGEAGDALATTTLAVALAANSPTLQTLVPNAGASGVFTFGANSDIEEVALTGGGFGWRLKATAPQSTMRVLVEASAAPSSTNSRICFYKRAVANNTPIGKVCMSTVPANVLGTLRVNVSNIFVLDKVSVLALHGDATAALGVGTNWAQVQCFIRAV